MNKIEVVIDDVLDEVGDLPPAVIAGKVRARLEEDDPAELSAWVEENLELLLAQVVSRVLRKRHAKTHPAMPSQFGLAARGAADGDFELLAEFLRFDDSTEDADGELRPISEFTARDHRCVAERYQVRGQTALMLAAFHRQVSRLVGHGRTNDVLTADSYEALHDSILRRMS